MSKHPIELIELEIAPSALDFFFDTMLPDVPEATRRGMIAAIRRGVEVYTVEQMAAAKRETKIDPFNFVMPCKPNCSEERHAIHKAQWDMAERIQTHLQKAKDLAD